VDRPLSLWNLRNAPCQVFMQDTVRGVTVVLRIEVLATKDY
jgi:hypothetical protein